MLITLLLHLLLTRSASRVIFRLSASGAGRPRRFLAAKLSSITLVAAGRWGGRGGTRRCWCGQAILGRSTVPVLRIPLRRRALSQLAFGGHQRDARRAAGCNQGQPVGPWAALPG
jgi:hypothetical protein